MSTLPKKEFVPEHEHHRFLVSQTLAILCLSGFAGGFLGLLDKIPLIWTFIGGCLMLVTIVPLVIIASWKALAILPNKYVHTSHVNGDEFTVVDFDPMLHTVNSKGYTLVKLKKVGPGMYILDETQIDGDIREYKSI